MLARFRKPGGFQQLLTLVETCEPEKRKSLLHMVSSEDPGWAHLVKVKALTFERILSWPQETLTVITPHLPDSILLNAYKMAEKSLQHEKWLKAVPSLQAQDIKISAQNLQLTAEEQFSTSIKIIQTVRELVADGQIQFADFDPALIIDERLAA
jgi:flagellar motor switch protein FliG